MKNNKIQIFVIGAMGVVVFVLVFFGIVLTRNAGK